MAVDTVNDRGGCYYRRMARPIVTSPHDVGRLGFGVRETVVVGCAARRAVGLGVAVAAGVAVGIGMAVGIGVAVAIRVAVGSGVPVAVGVAVAVAPSGTTRSVTLFAG
ncbi:MAG: hypothetical protein ACXV5Q_01800 [Frankiaceae bacterium]